jgi:endonuclease/exonuclease/phosphatase (EEP) superfamily protein YafD
MLKLLALNPYLVFGGPTAAYPDVPTDENVLKQSGKYVHESLAERFNLLVWNIHKAEDGSIWQQDFKTLSQQSDIVLLQEGHQSPVYQNATEELSTMLWSFVTSFVYKGFDTGVVIGSNTKPLKTSWLRSPGREPLLASPKMTALSEFDISVTKNNLLIANIHGINFVTNGTFYDHINQVIAALQKHDGPLIFAGDFNTWNSGRFKFLSESCEKLGLKIVNFKQDPRKLPLDHIFYRGLTPTSSEILESITSSDHLPLRVGFKIETDPS